MINKQTITLISHIYVDLLLTCNVTQLTFLLKNNKMNPEKDSVSYYFVFELSPLRQFHHKYLSINNPGHWAEATLEADQVETETNDDHGRVVSRTVLSHELPLLPALLCLALPGWRDQVALQPGPGNTGAVLRTARIRSEAVAAVHLVVLPGAGRAAPELPTAGGVELSQAAGPAYTGGVGVGQGEAW